jgi:tetratricopeptide (TPR) repeat protein
MSVSFRLKETAEGTIVWTRAFEKLEVAGNSRVIAAKVATPLAQPYGVIYARQLAKVVAGEGDFRYRCLIQAFENRRFHYLSEHDRPGSCLQRAVTIDPGFASGYAALALLLMREHYGDDAGESATLDWALSAAVRAVELRPQSARSRQALMSVLFARGQIGAALAEGEKAIALNPHDLMVLTAYGLRLAGSGNLERGMALLEHAASESPARVPAHYLAFFLHTYLKGDDANASLHASLLPKGTSLALLARAMMAARAGDHIHARQIAEELAASRPAWRNPRKTLERFIPSAELVDRLSQDLTALGPRHSVSS